MNIRCRVSDVRFQQTTLPTVQVCLMAWALLTSLSIFSLSPARALQVDQANSHQGLQATVAHLASFGDRSTGSPGNSQAAEYIKTRLARAKPQQMDTLEFMVPVLKNDGATLNILDKEIPIRPIFYNAIVPQKLPEEGLTGELIYAGKGELADFNGKKIENSIVLMEFDSGNNWLNAASLGASALIYINRGITLRNQFLEKEELSPLQFPCFWIEDERLLQLIPDPAQDQTALSNLRARLTNSTTWTPARGKNIWALFPGTDQDLQNQLIVVEAFYDATSFIPGRAPGADEALSIAGLLNLAEQLRARPPKRPFLLMASDAHAHSQAGMRETIWAMSVRSKDLRKQTRELKTAQKNIKNLIGVLKRYQQNELTADDGLSLQEALNHSLKLRIDLISTDLMQLRMSKKSEYQKDKIAELAAQRLLLRRLSWRNEFSDLTEEEKGLLAPLVEKAIAGHTAVLKEIKGQRTMLGSAKRLRTLMADFEPRALVSLHLSSHGNGLGAFHRGFLYPLRPRINRTAAFRDIDTALKKTAAESSIHDPVFISTLRPDRLHPWQDLLPDKPRMGGEVGSLAGLPGLTIATTNDLRSSWGTPFDTMDRIDWDSAVNQWQLTHRLIRGLDHARELNLGYIRDGFSTISGQAKLLLHGELFAVHPASDTVLLAFQGLARYHLLTDRRGRFLLKGVADKKHVLDKVILEGYHFSDEDGSIIRAIDKKLTGKSAYRIKMQRQSMQTDLVMFNCRQTTIFNLLEPRNLHYMTKLQLIDGRREAPPVRYWYSRIDTRSSIIASIFLEPGTQLKLTLSDSVLKKKMILTAGSKKNPMGSGYRVDDYPLLYHTNYLAARDMWSLLTPRINNLESHGIHNERIRNLKNEGLQALAGADLALKEQRFDTFSEDASRSWALASRVYDHVEKTQKDVLFGVLFYITLFVPFAFCMERLLFGFVSIYKRIGAFCAILTLLIFLIARVHPAFELAYSPTVVILAFFIIGLSFLVTMIIIIRFEDEMILMQRRATHKRPAEISNWKAFTAAFFLGVSNLRRRRLRTVLTCLTLIILTFTIMSFTTVKSMRRQNQLQFADKAPYHGILMKNIDWRDLPTQSLSIFKSLFDGQVLVAPRVWLGAAEQTRAARIKISCQGQTFIFQGLTGLAPIEPEVSGLQKILIKGRWFRADEPYAVLIPSGLAARLNIDPDKPDQDTLDLWGLPLTVTGVFSEKLMQHHPDLDGEILTPVVFPSETMMEISEVEKEALESGEDVRSFQGRYNHIAPEQVLILPAKTLLQLGGRLKAAALHFPEKSDENKAHILTDRFSLSLFSGEKNGVFVYNASDTMSYSGMPNIVIPLLISILIVLNTMISSVYERKREIAVYTSVGLAPSHVSFLFIAEALAFAVLSVVLGYLLAQTSAGLLAGTKFWSGITVNYSSTAGVAAMVLVMGVVLLSVIYPSRVAASIAIPDVNRSWKMPDAVDNSMHVTLPFLMRYHEHASICGFLHAYFKGHQDISHGLFATGPIEVVEASTAEEKDGTILPMAEGCMHLRTKVWLAPFDFGIMQWVDLSFCHAREGKEFLEICVTMNRRSGEFTLWRRINTSFVHALRKQLLIWRSLDDEGHAQYSALLPKPTVNQRKSS